MKQYLLWLFISFFSISAFAHPMPSSLVNLSVLETNIDGEAKIPLFELENAVGIVHIARLNDPFFKTYFANHIKAATGSSQWNTRIENISVISNTDALVGTYKEVVIHFTLTPPDARLLRTFTFNYDAVIHQVVTHSALIYVSKDWSNGIQDDNSARQVGIIGMDVPSGKILPLQVNLEEGTWWKGFKSMLNLGMQHIKEGTDHLLFLIVLLLPAMLLTNGKRWAQFGGTRYSIIHLLKIVTAFTVGHSITLLAGASGLVKLPGQPVEVMIAVSILVSAIHAIRPIFPGKETFIAAGFGLIHGLAFATVLSNLNLSAGKLAVSILGFNLGIEIMQLFVVAIMVPWLILLSKTTAYKWARITGAIAAAIASLGWIVERCAGKTNLVTGLVEVMTRYEIWGIAALAFASLAAYAATMLTQKPTAFVYEV